MTYEEAIDYLKTLTNYEQAHQPEAMRQVRLDRMQWLCRQLGYPQRAFRSILVAGTNAKGSICAMVYAILRAAGLRVGLYTSPHLADVRERIRVSVESAEEEADWISRQAFADFIGRLHPLLDVSQTNPDGPVTYFEVMTAVAFLYFAQQGVRVGVLEVGLGGRCDATNVVQQDVSVIGPIGFDHADVLGPELTAIAREKAGIVLKETVDGKPLLHGVVISAPQLPDVLQAIEEAVGGSSRLVVGGRHIDATILRHGSDGLEMTVKGLRGQHEGVHLPLIGRHQAMNAAMAIAAVETLAEEGVPYGAIRQGLASVQWPGRLEVVQGRPLVILDGAHNPEALQVLRETLQELWPNRAIHLLVGMSSDKSAGKLGACLAPYVASITCTRSRHPRAADPSSLAQHLKAFHQSIEVIEEPVDAYTYLINRVSPEDVLVVAGSLFLVGELRSVVRRHAHTAEVGS